MLKHVSMVLNTRTGGSDGKIPWWRIRGRAFNQWPLGIGEQIFRKLPVKGPMANPAGNMGARYRDDGEFLGYSRSSNVYTIGTDTGIKFARSIMRRPPVNRWSSDRLKGLKTTPWSEGVTPEVTVAFADPPAIIEQSKAVPPEAQEH